jgi:hypothetical protein
LLSYSSPFAKLKTYGYLEDENAAVLMKRGIVEPAYEGERPEIPHNFRFWSM